MFSTTYLLMWETIFKWVACAQTAAFILFLGLGWPAYLSLWKVFTKADNLKNNNIWLQWSTGVITSLWNHQCSKLWIIIIISRIIDYKLLLKGSPGLYQVSSSNAKSSFQRDWGLPVFSLKRWLDVKYQTQRLLLSLQLEWWEISPASENALQQATWCRSNPVPTAVKVRDWTPRDISEDFSHSSLWSLSPCGGHLVLSRDSTSDISVVFTHARPCSHPQTCRRLLWKKSLLPHESVRLELEQWHQMLARASCQPVFISARGSVYVEFTQWSPGGVGIAPEELGKAFLHFPFRLKSQES